jgi:hypothetical protein
MAFFGLTSLGVQNEFYIKSKACKNLQIFEDVDFKYAWQRVNGDEEQCRLSKLNEVFQVLFRGPVPPSDKAVIDEAFDIPANCLDYPDIIFFSHYLKIMTDLRERSIKEERDLEKTVKPGCEFSSSLQYQDEMIRHHRMGKELQDKQIGTLTNMQEYGWEVPKKLRPPEAGRGGTDITKFAAELVKNGIYY